MIDVEEIDGGFRVVDAAKNEVTIEIDDWEPGGEELEIGYDVSETLTGTGTEIRLPESGFLLESSELDHPKILNMNERIFLETGDYLCRLAAVINVLIRVSTSESVTIENSKNGIVLSFPGPTGFTLGFREFDKFPREKVSVPPSPEGLAAALEACGSIHETEAPDRSLPSNRPAPPRIEFDVDAPIDNFEENQREKPIHFRIPHSYEYLFPLAPFAYYLGARVTAERRTSPIIELDSVEYELPQVPRFSDEVAELLRRVFYLDCLIREAGPRCLGIREVDLLDDAPWNPERLYGCSMLDRVQEYLEFPFETIDSALPDWPLATFVEPTVENLPSIPFLIDRLSMVFPPRSSPIDQRTLVERSLGDFYRSTSSGSTPDSPIEVVSPESQRTRVQGWIAPGNPVDAFKCVPEAFENQRDYLVSTSEPISINVVLNDDEMVVEHSRVVQIYRDRAEELSLELDIVEGATTKELAQAFESSSDFLHYIGHCDPSGLRCIDGNLSAEELSRSRARTFFLNACGSYVQGLELIRKGSVAGAVTFGDVIDDQAAKVGGNFARLYMHGYTIERALFHARGQAIMNRQYAIVGDGTHVLTQGGSIQPAVSHVSVSGDSEYAVKLEATPVNLNGGVLLAYVDSMPNLMGNHEETLVGQTELVELLRVTDDPIIYENQFYWPEELLEELT